MRLRISPQDECRTLIWTLDQMRQAVEAKMHFELQGLNTEKGQGEIPVALRRFFTPIPGLCRRQGRTRRNEGAPVPD